MTEELNQMETHLRAQLATLHESYEKAAKPIIDQIVRLRSMQPMPPIIIDLIRRAPQPQTALEQEILNLHSSLAGAVLHAEQGWARYEEKNKAVLAMESRIAELEASQHIPGAEEK